MEWIANDVAEFMRKPAVFEALIDILVCVVPIWMAVMIGLVIGWSWKPRWTSLIFLGFRSKFRFIWAAAPPGLGARRLWLAFTALSAFSVLRRLWSSFAVATTKGEGSIFVESSMASDGSDGYTKRVDPPQKRLKIRTELTDYTRSSSTSCASSMVKDAVNEKDLDILLHAIKNDDEGSVWQSIMERSTPNMTYQAWRYEPLAGPTQYRSGTIFEDATPELVRDFFWDDEFRPKWDRMLTYCDVLEECTSTGSMIVHWIKKFPFFCSDREYIIGRQIWESGSSFYCVTKGVPYPAVPKREKPRRVDLYFSSWCIRPVHSRRGDGQLSACEVTLVHYEDMGIPKDVAKVGVRHGMWKAVERLHSGVRAYQNARASGTSPSRYALMARINAKISAERISRFPEASSSVTRETMESSEIQGQQNGNRWKWIVIGGTIAVVCGVHTNIVGKALLFGAARRLAARR